MKTIKIKLEGGMMPRKATPSDACYDLYCPEDYVVRSGRQVLDLKFRMELPSGYEADIKPRSGFSAKGMEVRKYAEDGGSITLLDDKCRINADVILGTVDEKYRGHVGVIINAYGHADGVFRYIVPRGTRIAQMQIHEVPETELVEADELDMSQDRGGGFGHTGTR